jgi:HEAT repeats
VPTRSLPALLSRLEAALTKQGLARPEDFGPGLDRSVIRERTAGLPFAILDELVALYQWHDGLTGADLLPGLSFISLDTAIERYESAIELLSRGLGPWELDWFPVFESGGCEHFVRCGRVEHAELWYSCPEFDDLGWAADSLSDWVEWCVRVYEEGAMYDDPAKGLSIDAEKSVAIRREVEVARPDVSALVEKLTADDQLQRIKARNRLMAYRYPEAVEPVLELLQSEEHEVVVSAAKILASSGRAETIGPLIKVAARWELRGHLDNPVLHQLYRYGPDTVTLLTDALSAGDEELRAAAATCIGALGDARAYPALNAARSDPSALVRYATKKALERLERV